jgi:hypothetical protein
VKLDYRRPDPPRKRPRWWLRFLIVITVFGIGYVATMLAVISAAFSGYGDTAFGPALIFTANVISLPCGKRIATGATGVLINGWIIGAIMTGVWLRELVLLPRASVDRR